MTMHAPTSPAAGSPFLDVRGVSAGYGRQVAVRDVDLVVREGEFVSLLGPSGCGKTTLLRVIAGLTRAQSGKVVVAGVDITDQPAYRRNVGVVFQNYALFPHLNVLDNIAFGLGAHGLSRAKARSEARGMLKLVRLEDFADRSIDALSGGQQQRVAVARALAPKPRLVLFDEPFSALDRQLRGELQLELRRLLAEIGMTAIFVTHDQTEAFAMSDRIGVMRDGSIEQFDTPQTLYSRPATRFVLDFVGTALRIDGVVREARSGNVVLDTPYGAIEARGNYLKSAHVTLAARPERITVRLAAEPVAGEIFAMCTGKTYLGGETLCQFEGREGDRLVAIVREQLAADLAIGRSALLAIPSDAAIILPRSG